MLKLTKTGIGLLTKQYRSVLRKCFLLNLGLFILNVSVVNARFSDSITLYNSGSASLYDDYAQSNYIGSYYYHPELANAEGHYTGYGLTFGYSSQYGYGYYVPTYQFDISQYIIENIKALDTKLYEVAQKSSPDLSNYQSKITGAATTITSSNLTGNRVLISNGSGKVAVSSITTTQLGYLSGVSSNIQTQLNNKAAKSTTLSGYGITNAYTKTEIDALLADVSAPDMSNYYTKSETYSRDEIANLDSLNYYYTFRVDERAEVIDYTSFFQKDFSTLQEVDLQSKNPTHLGAFTKCDEVCPRPSERFVSSLSQEQMFKNDASVDAGTSRHCLRQFGDVVADLLKNTAAKSLRISEFMNEEVCHA